MFKNKKSKGFTLIEILIVIGIIAVLATIVIIAINPARQFAQARDTQRTSNINTILNAIGQKLADDKGLPLSATTCSAIGTVPDTTPDNIGTSSVNLTCLVPTYISTAIPMDPSSGTVADTKYSIKFDGIRYTICDTVAETAIPRSAGALCVTR